MNKKNNMKRSNATTKKIGMTLWFVKTTESNFTKWNFWKVYSFLGTVVMLWILESNISKLFIEILNSNKKTLFYSAEENNTLIESAAGKCL